MGSLVTAATSLTGIQLLLLVAAATTTTNNNERKAGIRCRNKERLRKIKEATEKC